MNPLRKLFQATEEKTMQVVLTESCMLNGRPREAGETVTATESSALQLIAAGRAYSPELEAEADAERAEADRLIPPPVEPKPMPENWKPLPKSFHTWWSLNASYQSLCTRYLAIEEKVIGMVKGFAYAPSPNAFAGLRGKQLTDALSKSISDGQAAQDYQKNLRPISVLKDALIRAHRAIDDWTAANQDNLLRARVECSDHTQLVCGSLAREVRELHELGFQLFQTRIAALGLGDWHARSLFRDSADAVRFTSVQEPQLQDLRLGWYDPATGPKHILDVPVPVMVQTLERWEPIAEEVAKLTKQATTELAKARKVAA